MKYQRKELSKTLSGLQDNTFDVIIIGGGATGLGCALDASLRGYSTLLVEKDDFAAGTSSKSTKLIHGGVRYLQQLDFPLVNEALFERGILLKNAPEIVKPIQFLIPTYSYSEKPYYYSGLKLYDFLARKDSIGLSQMLSKEQVKERIGNIKTKGLKGGLLYHDAQFDDALLAMSLVTAAIENGGVCVNYCEVKEILHSDEGRVKGVSVFDKIEKRNLDFTGKAIVNASGIFSNMILTKDKGIDQQRIMTSRGSHIIVDKEKLATDSAILIPKTKDGRVIFAVPWYDKVVIGTTDIVEPNVTNDAKVTAAEVDYLLETINRYLRTKLNYEDIRSTYCGIRPLVKPLVTESPKDVSRRHKIEISDSGMISIMGGKWTTYRAMAEDAINLAAELSDLPKVQSRTKDHYLKNPNQGMRLCDNGKISEQFLTHIVENQMVTSLADILARRTRHSLLHVERSKELARKLVVICNKNNIEIDINLQSFYSFSSTFDLSTNGQRVPTLPRLGRTQ